MTTTKKRIFAIGVNPIGIFFGPKEQILEYDLDNILEIQDLPEKHHINRVIKLVTLSTTKDLQFHKYGSDKNGELVSKQLYVCYCLNISWSTLVNQMFKHGCNQFEVLDGNVLYNAITNSENFGDSNDFLEDESYVSLIKDYIFGDTDELPEDINNKQIIDGLSELFGINLKELNIHHKRKALTFVRSLFTANKKLLYKLKSNQVTDKSIDEQLYQELSQLKNNLEEPEVLDSNPEENLDTSLPEDDLETPVDSTTEHSWTQHYQAQSDLDRDTTTIE